MYSRTRDRIEREPIVVVRPVYVRKIKIATKQEYTIGMGRDCSMDGRHKGLINVDRTVRRDVDGANNKGNIIGCKFHKYMLDIVNRCWQ
jgi:hypothetical protein